MNIKELTALSDEELRVKVAEKIGYTDITFCPLMGFHQERSDERAKECGGRWRFALPPFSTSLDAIHDAEKTLSESQRIQFMNFLGFACGMVSYPVGFGDWFYYVHATARQRAIAFLLV